MRRVLLALGLILVAGQAAAVQPDEMMNDPGQEARARDISEDLRCLVCRNESIDESNADLARDLRLLVRERIRAGDTNEEVMAFVTDRYGEFVLLRPRIGGANLILWGAGPVMLLVGLGLAGLAFRQRRSTPAPEALSDAETRRLHELTDS